MTPMTLYFSVHEVKVHNSMSDYGYTSYIGLYAQ